jgi:hypothetical protein
MNSKSLGPKDIKELFYCFEEEYICNIPGRSVKASYVVANLDYIWEKLV